MNKRYSANLYVIISILLGYFLSLVVFREYTGGVNSALLANVLNIINNIVITFIPLIIFGIFNKKTTKEMFKKISTKKILWYIFITPAIWSASNYFNSEVNLILKQFGIVLIEQMPRSNQPEALVSGFILACVVAPVFEELFYRGAVLSLLRGYGREAAIVLSAFLFALAHRSITIFGSPFILGIVTAYVTIANGSIWPAIIIHFVNNLLSWIVMTFSFGVKLSAIISAVMIVVGAAWLIWALINILRKRTSVLLALKQILNYFKNPTWIVIVINYIYTNILIHG